MNNENETALEAYHATLKEADQIWSSFAKACGLSDAEYWILLMMREGYLTQSEICSQLSMSKQTVHSALKQLALKGLVRLEAKADNLRTKQILFTRDGEAFARNYIDHIYHIEEQTWAVLEPKERESLVRLSQKYNRLLKDALRQYWESHASPHSEKTKKGDSLEKKEKPYAKNSTL